MSNAEFKHLPEWVQQTITGFKGSEDRKQDFARSLQSIVRDCQNLQPPGKKEVKASFRSLASSLFKVSETASAFRGTHLFALQSELHKLAQNSAKKKFAHVDVTSKDKHLNRAHLRSASQPKVDLLSQWGAILEQISTISEACTRLAKSYEPTVPVHQPGKIQDQFETHKPVTVKALAAQQIFDLFNCYGQRFVTTETGYAAECLSAVLVELKLKGADDCSTVKSLLADAKKKAS
jgi:hypothetical protein